MSSHHEPMVLPRSADHTMARSRSTEVHQLALPWIVRLRHGMIGGEIALIAGIAIGFQIPLPLGILSLPIAVQLVTNWVLSRRTELLNKNAELLVGALFLLDTVCLTLILAMTGGPANPFSLLYLVQITFSAVILHKAWTWGLGILSTLCFGSLFWLSRDIPQLHIHVPPGEFPLHLFGMWLAFATGALLISFFIGKVSEEARQKEQEILAMQSRLNRNERLASLVTLAAGAAHEIATPLSTIAVAAKEIEHSAVRQLAYNRIEEDAVLIRSQVERCRLILERMGAQGADPFGEAPRCIDFPAFLERVRQKFPNEEKRIRIEVGSDLPNCTMPENAGIEAVSALVKNALDASAENGLVSLHVRSRGEVIQLLVRDQGVGMTPEVLDRVLEPFFTTKPPGQGMGLGAFLAHLFAQRLGGHLSFESQSGRGCTAVMELPVATNGRV